MHNRVQQLRTLLLEMAKNEAADEARMVQPAKQACCLHNNFSARYSATSDMTITLQL